MLEAYKLDYIVSDKPYYRKFYRKKEYKYPINNMPKCFESVWQWLEWLKYAIFSRLTSLKALNMFGCFRLASRISELKRTGEPIEMDMITTMSGKRVAEYSYREGL